MRFFKCFVGCLFLCLVTISLHAQESPAKAVQKKSAQRELGFEDIQQAIIQAESVQAREYASEDMRLADESLAKARTTTKKSDRQKFLAEAKTHLDKAYSTSKTAYAQNYIARLDTFLQEVQAKNLNIYAAQEAATIQRQVDQTKQAIQNDGINEKTRYTYDRTWQNIKNFDEVTQKNMSLVSNFAVSVRQKYSEKGLQLVSIETALANGDILQQEGKLAEALQSYKDAMTALNQSQVNEEFTTKLAEVDRLLFALKNDLEKANKLLVVHMDGSVTSLEPFTPEEYLANNPLVQNPSIPVLFENTYYTDLTLTPYDIVDITNEVPAKIEVAADISDAGLYEQSVLLWQQGIVLRNGGYMDDAKKYFQRSREYLTVFKRGAIATIYTVQDRPQTEDTLWRIAGFKDVYNNPYLWPLLWQRNRTTVSNPDLLVPGQKLLVPAID